MAIAYPLYPLYIRLAKSQSSTGQGHAAKGPLGTTGQGHFGRLLLCHALMGESSLLFGLSITS